MRGDYLEHGIELRSFLYQKPGGGFRPISITSCFSKMIERILLNRLRYVIGDKLHGCLYGFIKGKGDAGVLIKYLGNDADYCRAFCRPERSL